MTKDRDFDCDQRTADKSVSNSPEVNGVEALLREIEQLKEMVRARDKRITELGNLIHKNNWTGSSKLKRKLVSLWDSLPKKVQRNIMPFADFVDRVVK